MSGARSVTALARWWFVEAPARRLAAVRIVVGVYGVHQLTVKWGELARIARTSPDQWRALGPWRLAPGPIDPAAFDVWQIAHYALAILFVGGFAWRVVAPVYAASAICFLAYRTSWGGTLHADNLFVLHLVCLALGPAAAAWSVDAAIERRWPTRGRWLRSAPVPAVDWRHGWTLRLMGVVAVITYFLAGVAKLATNASGWLSGQNLVEQIAKDALYKALVAPSPHANEIVPWLYHHPEVMLVPSLLTLVVEVGAPIALLDRRLGWLWSVGAWCMHEGIFRIMNIVFPYPSSGAAFACFFPLEVWVDRAYAWAARVSRTLRSKTIASS